MRARRPLALAIAVVLGALVAVGCCTPNLAARMMLPDGAFDDAKVPPAPDYANDRAWLALPTTKDEADAALASLPAATSPEVDVFYVHPTSSIAPVWNAAWDNADVRTASIRGGTLIQASAFNGCCAVYAPSYRQASGSAFIEPSEDGARAIEIAYADVRAAYDAFRVRAGSTRPFILAGHSQGAILLARLLREHIAPSADRARFVAAYFPGAPLTAEDLLPFHACTSRDDLQCVLTYNARGPGHARNMLEIGTTLSERDRLCTNPVRASLTNERVSRDEHGGAVFFDTDPDSGDPVVLSRFATSTCKDGRLVVEELGALPPRDRMSGILMWVLGGENYHPIEVQLFYVDLREDAKHRASLFLACRPAPAFTGAGSCPGVD